MPITRPAFAAALLLAVVAGCGRSASGSQKALCGHVQAMVNAVAADARQDIADAIDAIRQAGIDVDDPVLAAAADDPTGNMETLIRRCLHDGVTVTTGRR